jgi:histidine triad (HIT) family protein
MIRAVVLLFLLSAAAERQQARGLDGLYDEGNPFAQILRGEAPVSKVYEDADVLAFLPINMQSRGHVLVISKTSRARNILEIDPAAFAKVMAVAQRIARAQRAVFKPDGIRIQTNSGEAAGQSVFHLHVHVIPMYAGQPLKTGERPPDDRGELDKVARQLAAALAR